MGLRTAAAKRQREVHPHAQLGEWAENEEARS
jgi:hypothetical protein